MFSEASVAMACKAKVNEDLVCPWRLFNIFTAILKSVSQLWYVEGEGRGFLLPLSVLTVAAAMAASY